MNVSEIDTPALLIDLDIMERNLCRVAEYCKAHELRLPRLSFEGITFYPGDINDTDDTGRQALAELSRLVQSILDDFRRAGVPVAVVSGGSTPALFHSHEVPGMNEIRPGTYVFNDL